MTKPTLFDLISDRLIWQCEHCGYCDEVLDIDTVNPDCEVLIRTYRGGKGHMVMIGYHADCWKKRQEMMDVLDGLSTSI